jgi:hypothetical protein
MQFKCEKTAKLGKKDLRGAAFQNMELAKTSWHPTRKDFRVTHVG